MDSITQGWAWSTTTLSLGMSTLPTILKISSAGTNTKKRVMARMNLILGLSISETRKRA